MTMNTLVNITADTTEAEIMRPIKAAKERLAEQARLCLDDRLFRGDLLVQLAQAVKDQEVLANQQARYLNALKHQPSQARLMHLLFSMVVRTDDTWSGRKNDSNRTAQDAVREWAAHQMLLLGGI